MKQFEYHTVERGMNIQKTFCAATKKEAAKLLDVSMYTINNYCMSFAPRNEECIRNPRQMFAFFDGGEASYAFPNLRAKIIKFSELKHMISEHRKTFQTYRETQEYAEHGKIPKHAITFKR
jgi:hypothetical protein